MRLGICGPIDTRPLATYLDDRAAIPHGLGGTPVVTLTHAALALGWEVTVFSLDSSVEREHIATGSHGLKLCLGPFRERHRARDLFRAERDYLARAIRRERPDVVHAHWTYEFALGALDSGFPTVVTAHDRPLQILRWDHSPYRVVRALMAAAVSRRAPRMTAVSQAVADHFRRCFRRAPEPQVIPNAIDDSWFRPAPREPGNTSFTFASVLTGWSELKNGRTLLEAFALVRRTLPDARLRLFGAGHGAGEPAERWAAERSLAGGVSFIGQVDSATLRAQFDEVHAMVHPSREESFSMSVAEAMASGIPLIAARQQVGCIANCTNALLVDGNSAPALAAAMLRLGGEAELRSELAGRARAVAMSRFQSTTVMAEYAAVYGSL